MTHLDEGTIHAWLDRELDAARAAEVQAHVDACAECAERVAEARGLVAGASRILSALDVVASGVAPARTGVMTALAHRWRVTAWAGGIAAALILAVGVATWTQRADTPMGATGRVFAVMDAPADSLSLDSTGRQVEPAAARETRPETPRNAAASRVAGGTVQRPSTDHRLGAGAGVVAGAGEAAGPAGAGGPVPVAAGAQVAAAPAMSAAEVAGRAGIVAAAAEGQRDRRVGVSVSADSMRKAAQEGLPLPAPTAALMPEAPGARAGFAGAGMARVRAADVAGCYRLEVAGAVGVTKLEAVKDVQPAAVRTLAPGEADQALAAAPPVVHLDTLPGPGGYVVRAVGTGGRIGTWSPLRGDSMLVNVLASGSYRISRTTRVNCPVR